MVVQTGVTTGGNKKDFQGMAADAKPTTDIGNGSTFFEIDTKFAWIWHVDQWYKM